MDRFHASGWNGAFQRNCARCCGGWNQRPGRTLATLPYTLLIGLAAPLKKIVEKAHLLHVQGEDLFLRRLEGAL